MKHAINEVTEIYRMEKAIDKTKSNILKKQYKRAIFRRCHWLMEYCKYKDVDYKDLMNYAKCL